MAADREARGPHPTHPLRVPDGAPPGGKQRLAFSPTRACSVPLARPTRAEGYCDIQRRAHKRRRSSSQVLHAEAGVCYMFGGAPSTPRAAHRSGPAPCVSRAAAPGPPVLQSRLAHSLPPPGYRKEADDDGNEKGVVLSDCWQLNLKNYAWSKARRTPRQFLLLARANPPGRRARRPRRLGFGDASPHPPTSPPVPSR